MPLYAFSGYFSQAYNSGAYESMSVSVLGDLGAWRSGDDTKLVCPASGWYCITGVGQMEQGTANTTSRFVRILVNGSNVHTNGMNKRTTPSSIGCSPLVMLNLNAGDQIEVQMQGPTGQTAFGLVTIFALPEPFYVGGATGATGGTPVAQVEQSDTPDWHSDVTNPDRVTVDATGNYLVLASIPNDNAVGATASITVNGTVVYGTGDNLNTPGEGQPIIAILPLASGDIVRMNCGSTSGLANQMGLCSLGSLPCVEVKKATAQSIAGSAFLAFDTEQVDTDGFHDNVTNNSRLTIPAGLGGFYLINSALRMTGLNYQDTRTYRNGALFDYPYGHSVVTATAVSRTSTVPMIHCLADGDYIQALAGHDSGAAQSTVARDTHFGLVRLDDCPGLGFVPRIYRSD